MDPSAALEEVGSVAKHASAPVAQEVGKIGKTFFSQLLGISDDTKTPDQKDLNSLDKKDKDFQKKSEAEWKLKYDAIYEQYRQKKKKMDQIEQKQEERIEEAQKLEDLNQKKVNVSQRREIAATRTESGKNYGNE